LYWYQNGGKRTKPNNDASQTTKNFQVRHFPLSAMVKLSIDGNQLILKNSIKFDRQLI